MEVVVREGMEAVMEAGIQVEAMEQVTEAAGMVAGMEAVGMVAEATEAGMEEATNESRLSKCLRDRHSEISRNSVYQSCYSGDS